MVAAGALIGSVVARQSRTSTETQNLEAAAVEARHSDILLREMQHRVKNNFQLILSSVSMQKRRHKSEEVRGALDKIASLIQAISLAHDQLAPRHGSQVVKLADYLRALCHSIRQQVDGIEIELEADEMELPVDRALALGLILNEAAVNSIKHAFNGDGGRIAVRLESGIGYGEGRLCVADNGSGFAAPRGGGSGLKFMTSLARQIGGTLEQQSSGEGTTILVSFPVLA
jgi:two-component sensor histidine kinase